MRGLQQAVNMRQEMQRRVTLQPVRPRLVMMLQRAIPQQPKKMQHATCMLSWLSLLLLKRNILTWTGSNPASEEDLDVGPVVAEEQQQEPSLPSHWWPARPKSQRTS